MNAVIEQRDAALSQVSLYKYIISEYQISFVCLYVLGFLFYFWGKKLFCFLLYVENLKGEPL